MERSVGLVADHILEVRHLSTYFMTGGAPMRAVDDLSYTVERGECLSLIHI